MDISQTLRTERVAGPFLGKFVAMYACRMGELGNEYLGYYKICSKRPVNFLDVKGDLCGFAEATAFSARDALLTAQAAALTKINDLYGTSHHALPGDGLVAAVYVASTVLFSSRDIGAVLGVVSARNRLSGITSVVLYDQGDLIQYLEGSEDAVLETIDAVRLDPRYKGLIELVRYPISKREFPDWPVKYFSPDSKGPFETDLAGDHLAATRPSPGRVLLTDFWSRARGNKLQRAFVSG